ncbi:type VI secretion system contractile sheath large subunit [Aliamphritea ceti]|uniref:type VI secretion system contractile sheath large subunit n=1 Tax=Aliamphritea ceti TaxID=1524258 RepID=UPI0021C26505|nr:type VI secretion system contractile sheath large subunit [Aliamphritea ceti]
MFQDDWQDAFNVLDPQEDDYLTGALTLIGQWDEACLQNSASLKSGLNRLIAALDQQLSTQLSEVMHHQDFSELEARWRNVQSLVTLPVNYQRVEIKLLDISWRETVWDINTAASLKNSRLYNKIGNKELNTMGGKPFGAIVIDHQVSMEMDFDDDYDDLYTLELLGQLGSICLCPFLLAPAEDFFGYPGADWLSDTQRIGKILEGPDYVGWQQLRNSVGARFVGLVLPQIKLRDAYENHPIGFVFDEPERDKPGLWGSAAFAFASIIIREYNRINWFGFMKSRWQDKFQGSLLNLPPNATQRSPLSSPATDVRLFGRLASFYSEQGFVPLAQSSLTEKFYFYGNNSVWKSRTGDADKVICQLQTTMMVCRIAHYLKVQIRGMIGGFRTAAECELFLSQWLDNYCSNISDGDEATLARYPLRKSDLKIREVDGSQGRFSCEVVLQPQYQFDNFFGEVVLATDLGEGSDMKSGALA